MRSKRHLQTNIQFLVTQVYTDIIKKVSGIFDYTLHATGLTYSIRIHQKGKKYEIVINYCT